VIKQDGRITVISGHEQISTVNGSVLFSSSATAVNPGLSLYTWLSERSLGWEKYMFKRFDVIYIPAEAVTTTPGSIYLAAEYDPKDAAPVSLAAMSTYENQVSGRVFESVRLKFNPRRMNDSVRHKLIRQGPISGDLSVYDSGRIIVSTISCSDASAIGQLWVDYEIDLISPQVGPVTPSPTNNNVYQNTALALASGVVTIVPWDTTILDGLGLTNASGVFTMPYGAYVLSGHVVLNNTAAELTTLQIVFYKNGVITPSTQGSLSMVTTVVNGRLQVSFQGYFTSAGSDTLSVRVTASGAIGTLSTVAGYSVLRIQVV